MTSKPQFSALDPAAYLDLANELASRPEAEAKRTAADRAYYAAFLFSRDQLAAKGYLVPYYSLEDHRYVAECLRELLGAVGNDENRLRQRRNTVTYDTRDLSSPSLQWMINTAQKITELVKELPSRA
ncbi:MAG: hypothetical protein HYX92_18780 [Chloroflexi bacterium]|nr:hypothetical protein [Chloroflexota bacterium]